MTEHDDLPMFMPEPPPPAPARREAAIAAALARFDGNPAPDRAQAATPAGLRTWIKRPQAGLIVATALVAAISLPLAWMRFVPVAPATDRMAEVAPTATQGSAPVAAEAPAPVMTAADAAKVADHMVQSAVATTDAAESAAPVADAAAPPAMLPPPPPPILVVPAPVMPAAPPRPPRASFDEARDSALALTQSTADANGNRSRKDAVAVEGQTVGKAAATLAGRGDWNICTVNDPRPDPASCRPLAKQAPRAVRDKANAALALGLDQAWQGDFSGAIVAFDQAIAAAPSIAAAYLNRGLAYNRQGLRTRALDDLDRAVRLAPRSARVYYQRSLLHRQNGDVRRAEADEAEAIRLDRSYRAIIR